MIDFHVHLYTADDLPINAGELPYRLPEPLPVKTYLDSLIEAGYKPDLVNNVHLSILDDSENIFRSFEELKRLQAEHPQRYSGIEMIGTILADPDYATIERLSHPQIKGIRLVLHDACPESITPHTYSGDDWQALYARLRRDQHIHIYAQEPEANLRVLKQIPADRAVVIDHLGTCRLERGPQDRFYQALLEEARSRGNVWFKGPGYRTANTAEQTAPFTLEIIKRLGHNRLLLECTDAPHVGTDRDGQAYAALFTPVSVLQFARSLADITARENHISEQALLNAACADIINPQDPKERTNMNKVNVEELTFTVNYTDGSEQLKASRFIPENPDNSLPPVVFNSGYTGGVSMYGQLMGNALAAQGYIVTTYDVSGFFSNRTVRNTFWKDDKLLTNVSLEDQTIELLALIAVAREHAGRMPIVISWAMGSVASLAAVNRLAAAGGEQIPLYVPMSYTRLRNLQNLRADAAGADKALFALEEDNAIPIFDTGTEQTKLGYYPLDPNTQDYVNEQLGSYTHAGGADDWPGVQFVTARSYQSYVKFDPESEINAAKGSYPPALIIHGANNSLHMPKESQRLFEAYPDQEGNALWIVEAMEHGQQLTADDPIFRKLIDGIDAHYRSLS